MTTVDSVSAQAPSTKPRPFLFDLFDAVVGRPLAVFAVGFTGGIALDAVADVPIWAAVVVLLICCALFVLAGRRRIVCLVALFLTAAACGSLRYDVGRSIAVDDVVHQAPAPGSHGRASTLVGEVATDPEPLKGRETFVLDVQSIDGVPASGSVYVTVRTQYDRLRPEGEGRREAAEYGDVVEVHGNLEQPKPRTNPGAFSWHDYLARRGIYCTLAVKRPQSVEVLRYGGNPLLAVAWRLRRSIVDTIASNLPSNEAAVAEGILIGWRVQLTPELTADFVHTGTVHILASAGLHVGILLAFLWLVFNRLTVHRKAAALSMIGLLILYAVLCGGRPSVVRAVIMAIVYLGALLFEREPDVPTALGAAALIILADTPYALLEPGFQLSFATVITLVFAMPVWDALIRPRIDRLRAHPVLRRVVLWAVGLTGLSIFAQLGSAPIVAAAYNETSISGVLANLCVVPVLFVLIPLGILGLIFGDVPVLGTVVFKVLFPVVWIVEWIVRVFGESSIGFAGVQTPSTAAIVAYYAVLWGLLSLAGRRLSATASP